MKYMGSKRAMLRNGLGELLYAELPKYDRLVDLFCGAGSVSWFAATNVSIPVLSVDLQSYAVTMASAIVERVAAIDSDAVASTWLHEARDWASERTEWMPSQEIDQSKLNTATWVKRSREFASEACWPSDCIVTHGYGAHYFSLSQSLLIDGLMQTLPVTRNERQVCLAAAIMTASLCAAAPGHTAQPFQPTRRAAPFLREAWKRDPLQYARNAVLELGTKHAKSIGMAKVGDAVKVAESLAPTDLVFVDPPYSGVHYSRFYHVLETIARAERVEVSGIGRYPPPEQRPTSAFSRRSEAKSAFTRLIEALAGAGSTVVVTFPSGKCSNGLSGGEVKEISERYFSVVRQEVKSRFSTLGGNNQNRNARHATSELILLLRPRAAPNP